MLDQARWKLSSQWSIQDHPPPEEVVMVFNSIWIKIKQDLDQDKEKKFNHILILLEIPKS